MDPHIRELLRDWTVRDWLIAAVVVLIFNVILASLPH